MTAQLVLRHPPGHEAERRYAYDVVLRHFLGLSTELVVEDRNDVEISLAGEATGATLRVADVLFATPHDQWLCPGSLPRSPLTRVPPNGVPHAVTEPLPVLYGRGEPLVCAESSWQLGIDVFGGAFFLLTRYEEIVSAVRDAHDRFPATASLLTAEGLLDRPLVNEYLELLWSLLSALWPRLERRHRAARLVLSHDVDLPLCRIPLAEARRLARRDLRREHAPVVALRRITTAALHDKVSPRFDLYNTFDLLMQESERLGLRSAFYFMGGNTGGAIDGNYALEEPWVRELLSQISARGHEIGFHPSYETYREPSTLRSELDHLLSVCVDAGVNQSEFGGRQHYLRWRNPVTWQSWEDAGLHYDTTLGFADRAGFRSGTCYEHPVFNLERRQALRLRERPLIVMDASLLEYQRLSLPAAAKEIERLARVVKRFGGEMTLLWHNDRLLSRQAKRAYRRAITRSASLPQP